MTECNILINTIDKVKNFVDCVYSIPGEMDLCSGRYVIDAKSIMGIFSLDISHPMKLMIFDDDEVETVREAIAPYIIENDKKES